MSNQKSDEAGSYTEAVGTRLTPQTMRQFQDYKERHELQNSEALRRLIRTAIETDQPGMRIVDADAVLERQPLKLLTFFAGLMYLTATLYLGNDQLGSAVGGVFITTILLWSFLTDIRNLLSI